jgi:hypothetical protein
LKTLAELRVFTPIAREENENAPAATIPFCKNVRRFMLNLL